ncbi:MAG: MFS transporter [Thermoleophilia bacterium]
MRRNVLLLALAQALLLTGNVLVVSTASLVGRRLAENPALATLPVATQLIGTMLTTIPASLLMARIGRRAGFALGAALGLTGALIAVMAIVGRNFPLFATGTTLIGIFNGFGVYYRFAAADAATPEYRSRAVSYVLAGGVVAAVAGPTLARWTRTAVEGADFAGSYAVLTLVYGAAVIVPLLTSLSRPPRGPDLAPKGRPLRLIASQPAFFVAMLAGTLGYAVMVLLMTATPLAMESKTHAFELIAFVIQAHVLGMFLPSFFTGSLIRRFGVLEIMLVGAVLAAAAVAVNLAGATGAHFSVGLLLLGVGWNFLFVGATTLVAETYRPEERAKAQALNDFVVWTAVTLASLSAGALLYQFGWTSVNLGAIPLVLLAGAAILWLRLAPARSTTGEEA